MVNDRQDMNPAPELTFHDVRDRRALANDRRRRRTLQRIEALLQRLRLRVQYTFDIDKDAVSVAGDLDLPSVVATGGTLDAHEHPRHQPRQHIVPRVEEKAGQARIPAVSNFEYQAYLLS